MYVGRKKQNESSCISSTFVFLNLIVYCGVVIASDCIRGNLSWKQREKSWKKWKALFMWFLHRMPYLMEKHPDGSYSVVNKKTGYIHAKHTTLSKAKAQIRLLGMIEAKEKHRK